MADAKYSEQFLHHRRAKRESSTAATGYALGVLEERIVVHPAPILHTPLCSTELLPCPEFCIGHECSLAPFPSFEQQRHRSNRLMNLHDVLS